MDKTLRRRFTALMLCVSLLLLPKPARAGSIPTASDVAWIGVAVGAIGAAIGVGIYFAVRQNPTLKGCATAGPSGLILQNEGDHAVFALIGSTATIKPGDRVKVSGKRRKKDAANPREFLVEKVSKDYGPCSLP